jgi:hypothetical protein
VDLSAPGHDLDLHLSTTACVNTGSYPPGVCTILARAESPTTKPEVLQSPVTPGGYRIVVSWCGSHACGTGMESGTVLAHAP